MAAMSVNGRADRGTTVTREVILGVQTGRHSGDSGPAIGPPPLRATFT
jgi:hypothetical protein